MELLGGILTDMLSKEDIQMVFPNLKLDAAKLVEMECYKTLQKIKTIIEDDSLSDSECFMKIEEIICLFEKYGCLGGTRHDFG